MTGRLTAASLAVLAAATFAIAAARYLPSPLRFDETEWVPQAQGILRHGVPMVTYAEGRRLFARPYYGYDAHYGMWHPPLFVYSLALSMAALGTGDVAMRLVPLAWGVLALWCAWRLARPELPPDPVLRAVPVAIALLSPLVLDGLFYVDIDNSAMAAAVMALAWLHVSLDTTRPLRRTVLLGAVLALALWSKLTTPVLMLAAIAAHSALRRGVVRACLEAAAVGLVGAALFAVTYWAYCRVLHYPAAFMFDFSYLGKRSAYSALQPAARMLHSLWWNVVWTSPALVAAGLWTLVQRIRRYVLTREVTDTDVLLIFAAITVAEYALGGALIGKYTAPAAMALAIVVGVECARGLETLRMASPLRVAAIAAALAAFHLLAIPPLVVRPAEGLGLAATGILAGALNARNLYLLVAVVAGLAACWAWRRLLATDAPARATVLASLLWLMAVNPVAQAEVLLASADRSPLRPFDDYGYAEVVRWLNDHAAATDIVLCPKDVGLRFVGRHYAIEPGQDDWAQTIQTIVRQPGVRFVVDSNAYPSMRDRRALDAAGFAPVAAAGDFVIYGRAGTSTPTGQVTPVPPRPQ